MQDVDHAWVLLQHPCLQHHQARMRMLLRMLTVWLS
jgi:hypothetical protein